MEYPIRDIYSYYTMKTCSYNIHTYIIIAIVFNAFMNAVNGKIELAARYIIRDER